MKILHINTCQNGGAAWCAIRINKALVAEDVESRMLFADGLSMPDGIHGAIAEPDENIWEKYRLLWIMNKILARLGWHIRNVDRMKNLLNQANTSHLFLHQPFSEYRNIAHHPLVEWADIIHLHWVSDFIDYPSFFKEVKKPIVWTLHDKYPAMGVQHFGSHLFQPLPDGLRELDAQCKKIKREGVTKSFNMNLVAISEKMVEICKDSDVLKGFPVVLIHNGVDTATFRPYDKQTCRKELGLLPDATIFLFSSYSISDERKGLDRIIVALEKIDIPNKMLVCIGNIPFGYSAPEASFPIIVTGQVTNQVKMTKYYSAVDYFLQGSYEEAFSQTPLEAMACGTPVISTPCSGATDLIRPFNGVICNGYDSNAIAAAITVVWKKDYDADVIRQHIIDNYNYDKIARQYIDLYQSVLA